MHIHLHRRRDTIMRNVRKTVVVPA